MWGDVMRGIYCNVDIDEEVGFNEVVFSLSVFIGDGFL